MKARVILLIPAAVLATATLTSALELKDITYPTTDAGKVVFSHKTHLQKKERTSPNFSCKTCHSSGAAKNIHHTMADMEKGKSCGACHDGGKAFALAQCTRCHKVREITYRVKETGPVAFSHNRHLRTMQCGSCHSRLFKTGGSARVGMVQMAKGKSCGGCHNGKKSFAIANCAQCHPVREMTYAVKGAGKVQFSHNFHIGRYGCAECHPRLYLPRGGNAAVSMAGMEARKSCGACHDGKTAFTVTENCARCHQV